MIETVVARSVEEVEKLRPVWDSMPIGHPHADLDFFLAVIEERREAIRPHVVLVRESGVPVGLVVARLEHVRLPATFGYRTVYNPRVLALTLVPGGAVSLSSDAASHCARALRTSLQQREADVAVFPSLRRDSALFERLETGVRRHRLGHFAEIRTHRRLRLPPDFDAFLAGRSRKVRSGVRYDTKRLEQRLGDRLRVKRFDSPSEADQVISDIVQIADLTYQKGLGASFADTAERQRLTRLALDNGWFRAWVMYEAERPIAFWQGFVYRRVYHSGTTGYDPSYARERVGICLLMRVIADLCDDADVDTFDYGFGDADYKRHFSDEAWDESDLTVFAPTVRGLSVNVGRTTVMATASQAKTLLERFGVADQLKTRWRKRLRAKS